MVSFATVVYSSGVEILKKMKDLMEDVIDDTLDPSGHCGSNPVGLFVSGMVGSCASMTEQQKYWRDKVSQVLGWGTAALLVVAGWSLEHTDQFEIGPWADQIKPGTALNAIGLIAFALIFSIGWVRSLKWIYDNHLVNCTDSTILPRSAVDRYAKLVGSLLVVVALLLSLG